MRLPPELRCPAHRLALAAEGEAFLVCALGCRVPVVGEIPRFVPGDGYAAAFGRQWLTYRRTQLDSETGTPISRTRLERCLGAPLASLRGRSVLEAGCGAGRFELLLDAGARVFACDLSRAVEANRENCRRWPAAILPIHRLFWRPGAAARAARRVLRVASPVLDYYDRYPELGPVRLAEWARLDTHDALTDGYKHLRSAGQIRAALESAGLGALEVAEAGNGIEARATRSPRG